MINTYLILKDNAGPWETVRDLFPIVPVKSIHPIIVSHRGYHCPCYEIDGTKLTEKQVQALTTALMWQSEDDPTTNFEKAASHVRHRVLIAKHWVDYVYAESPASKIVFTSNSKGLDELGL